MATLTKSPLPFNPSVLQWARKRSGLTVEEAAKKINVADHRLRDWESGNSSPSANQGRNLAQSYGRPFLEFFFKKPPELPQNDLVPDFRFYVGGPSQSEIRCLLEIQEWAEEQRANALALIEDLGDRPPVLSDNLRFSIKDNVDVAAGIVREALKFSITDQLALKGSKAWTLPNVLRERIEEMGVLVLKESTLTQVRARGMCLYTNPLPVIVFGNEAPSAQSFTLIHEFGHVLLGESGISGSPRFGSAQLKDGKAVESWCNQFAASFLIPKAELDKYFSAPTRVLQEIDQDVLRNLAAIFSVSRHALLIRLVNLGYVAANFYWRKMRAIFQAEESEHKSFGRPAYYGKRYINRNGRFFTGLVLEAWSSGIITGHNAAEYMGIKNLDHLKDIRDEFRI